MRNTTDISYNKKKPLIICGLSAKVGESITWMATLHQPPNRRDSHGNFYIVEDGEKGGVYYKISSPLVKIDRRY